MQGFMVGSLVMMACITVVNMRKRVLLHKLILIEVSVKINYSIFYCSFYNHN